MLKRGVIKWSCSPCFSNVVLIRKKDNTYRFCVDYRSMNEVTVRDAYPLPRIDECLDSLGLSQWNEMILLPQRKFRILANRHGSWWYRKDRCYKSWLVPIHCDAFWSYQPTLHFLEVEGGCPSRIAVGRVPSVFRWYYCSWINFWSNRRERAFFFTTEGGKFNIGTKQMHFQSPNQF